MTRRLMLIVSLAAVLLMSGRLAAQKSSSEGDERAVRSVVQQFEDGLKERDLEKIEAVIADDLVAFENGHRNDGWADFRDHHLVPEMKEPAPPMKTEFIRVSASPQMGWAYTRTELALTRRSGEKVTATLWSIYFVEKRSGQWKITMLDWSMYVPRPTPPK